MKIPDPPPADLPGTEWYLSDSGKPIPLEKEQELEQILYKAESAKTFLDLQKYHIKFYELIFPLAAHGYRTLQYIPRVRKIFGYNEVKQ